MLLHHTLFTQRHFTQRRFTHRCGNREALSARRFCPQKTFLRPFAHFLHRFFCTERLLRPYSYTFTHRHFWTEAFAHIEVFTCGNVYTQLLLHTTHRRLYTQKFRQTNSFTPDFLCKTPLTSSWLSLIALFWGSTFWWNVRTLLQICTENVHHLIMPPSGLNPGHLTANKHWKGHSPHLGNTCGAQPFWEYFLKYAVKISITSSS